MSQIPIIILCTTPDEITARTIAQGLISEHLAACVQIIPQITSVYRWQGTIETAKECQLMIKTLSHFSDQITEWIKENHPYEIPEILVLNVSGGNSEYINWIYKETIGN